MFEVPFPSEKFIEDFVVWKIESDGACPVSGMEVTFFQRQFEIFGYGIADIVKLEVVQNIGEPSTAKITVLELKNEPLKEHHLSQLTRYMRGLDRQAIRFRKLGIDVQVFGELAGPLQVDKAGDLLFMLGYLKNIDVYGLSFVMDGGFRAEEMGHTWHKTVENLNAARPIASELLRAGYFEDFRFRRRKYTKKPALKVVGGSINGL